METFKVVVRDDHRAVYASGFRTRERAEQWLAEYDPRMWMDKTIQRDDLEILAERRR